MNATCPKCGRPFEAAEAKGLCPSCVADMLAHPTEESIQEDPLAVGTSFHGLEIVELIGRGGMGVVYKARQPHLNRLVALKILPRKLADDEEFRRRFEREAKSLAGLVHPNIVAVHDFGIEGDLVFLVMEYVDGVDLRQVLRDGTLTPREALKIVPQLCDALEFAHGEGVVHRDIKPENILLDKKGRVKIADFGLAKLVGGAESEPITQSNVAMGTPHYMAPEQLENPKEIDHRVDIYSMGVVFYEMLTGGLPLGKFPPPSRKVEIDVRLDQVVLKALEKEPDLRYQRAGLVRDDVTRIAAAPEAKARAGALGAFLRVFFVYLLAVWGSTTVLLYVSLPFRFLLSADFRSTGANAFQVSLSCLSLWAILEGPGLLILSFALAVLFRRTNKEAVRGFVENRAARLGWIGVIGVGLGFALMYALATLMASKGRHEGVRVISGYASSLSWGVGMTAGLMVVRFARRSDGHRRSRRVALAGMGIGLLALVTVSSSALHRLAGSWFFNPEPNTEVRLKLFFDSNLSALERENQAIQTRKILEKRLELARVRAASIHLEGDEGLRVRFYGSDEAEIARVLALLRYRGELELKVVGSTQLHRKLQEEGKGYPAAPPEGYEWIANPGKRPDPERPFLNDEYILVRRDPVVTERNISTAEPSRSGNGVSFTLDEAGSKAFDDSAATLYHSIPSGMIAIVIDGQPKSIPMVNSPVLGGQGEISGLHDLDAKALAAALSAGRLPARIGAMESRRFIAPEAKP